MQSSLDLFDKKIPESEPVFKTDVRIDRGSRYGYACARVAGKAEIHDFLKEVSKKKPFSTATHNSYAFRIRSPEGILVEGKGDDGEAGAGLCILRELRRANAEQCCLVVSRHFGGIKLQNDRFKHVVDVAKMAMDNPL